MASIEEVNKNLEHIKQEMDYLNHHQVAIGFFGESGSQILTVVRANEYGAHIVPKNGQYLWIPSKYAIKDYGENVKPKDVDGLFVNPSKKSAGINKAGKYIVYFYLLKHVTIPARPFIRKAFLDNAKKYQRYIKVGIDEIVYQNGTGRQLLSKLGRLGVSDVRNSIRRFTKPGNAPLTIDNKKGQNNPLVDTGKLSQHVTWKILPMGGIE